MSTTEILEQVLDPFVDCLTPESATKIAALRADPAAQMRLDELADGGNDYSARAGGIQKAAGHIPHDLSSTKQSSTISQHAPSVVDGCVSEN